MASDERQKTVDKALCSLRSLIAGDETIHSGDKIDADEFHHALQRIAAEIEAAWKREKAEIESDALSVGGIVEAARHSPGNSAAMREALLKLRAEIGRFYNNEWIPYDAWQGCDDMISHAFSAPARQCDMGTPEEQVERYNMYCYDHRSYEIGCGGCPFNGEPCCELAWAQMPYDAEEGAGE